MTLSEKVAQRKRQRPESGLALELKRQATLNRRKIAATRILILEVVHSLNRRIA